MEMIENLDGLLKTFWYIAIPVSLVFIFQTIMTFIGSDVSDGIEADFDGDLTSSEAPFQLFSLRNLINFLLGFSWTGISFYDFISNPILLILISFIVGILFVVLFFFIIKQITQLSENNSFQLTETLHQTAEVYLTIPESKKGIGKIILSIKGSFHELEAICEETKKIETGSLVKIIKIENNKILVVKKI